MSWKPITTLPRAGTRQRQVRLKKMVQAEHPWVDTARSRLVVGVSPSANLPGRLTFGITDETGAVPTRPQDPTAGMSGHAERALPQTSTRGT
jgi:hypothetical protein